MYDLSTIVIFCLHVYFVLFAVLTPFISNNYLLLIHCLVVPFMFLHWITNNNTCAITLMEKKLRESFHKKKGSVESKDTFSGRLVEPVYDFVKNNKKYESFIYSATLVLIVIAYHKLFKIFADRKITNIFDIIVF